LPPAISRWLADLSVGEMVLVPIKTNDALKYNRTAGAR
jgi:hypothetical protein